MARSKDAGRIAVQNVNIPGKSRLVDAARYQAMRRALLKVLPSRTPGFTYTEMSAAVWRSRSGPVAVTSSTMFGPPTYAGQWEIDLAQLAKKLKGRSPR